MTVPRSTLPTLPTGFGAAALGCSGGATFLGSGIERGLGGDNVTDDYNADVPYTPAWAERHTGVKRADIITVAREFADNADKTHGKSMVIVGAALNHWYHNDMIYRGIMNMSLWYQ